MQKQCSGAPFIEHVQPRIDAIADSLSQGLTLDFKQSIATGDSRMRLQSLRTYALIDKAEDVELLFRDVAVAPFMERTIVKEAVKPSGEGLQAMYEAVLEFVRADCVPLMEVNVEDPMAVSPCCCPRMLSGVVNDANGVSRSGQTQAARSIGVDTFDFMSNSIWPEVAETISLRLKFIFSAGSADTFFHVRFVVSLPPRLTSGCGFTPVLPCVVSAPQNYTATAEFIGKLEAMCGTEACLERLRSVPSFTRFRGRWSLPVYFQLRFQEIAGSLEEVISAPGEAGAAASSGPPEFAGVTLPVVIAAAASLQRCWDDKVYLPELTHRFWKLALQVCCWSTVYSQSASTLSLPLLPLPGRSAVSSVGSPLPVDRGVDAWRPRRRLCLQIPSRVAQYVKSSGAEGAPDHGPSPPLLISQAKQFAEGTLRYVSSVIEPRINAALPQPVPPEKLQCALLLWTDENRLRSVRPDY